MINKPHRADSVPRPVSTRIPAAGTALPVSRRASSAAFRPPARPTVVHLPAAKMDWRRVAVAGVLGLCALSLAWWVSQRPEQRHAVAVDYPRPAPTPTPAEDIEQALARQLPAPEDLPPVSLAAIAPAVEKSVVHFDKGDTLTCTEPAENKLGTDLAGKEIEVELFAKIDGEDERIGDGSYDAK